MQTSEVADTVAGTVSIAIAGELKRAHKRLLFAVCGHCTVCFHCSETEMGEKEEFFVALR